MDIDSFFELKAALFAEWTDEGDQLRRRLNFQTTHGPPEPDFRIAIGYSHTGRSPRDVQAELRVQRHGSLAFEEARRIGERARGEARIRVVPAFEIPSIGAMLEAAERGGAPGARHFNPVCIGASISVVNGGTGTLGGFVQLGDGRTGFLSNNHVLARLGTARSEAQHGEGEGDRIYQPGRKDVARRRSSHCIGRLHEFVEIEADTANTVDIAVGLYEATRATLANVALRDLGAPEDRVLAQPREIAALAAAQGDLPPAAKIGRTTGYRTGRITAIGLDGVTVGTSGGERLFSQLTEISSDPGLPFSQPGDSGSVVFDAGTGTPFGLHFAGGRPAGEDAYLSLCCSLPEALDALDLRWL